VLFEVENKTGAKIKSGFEIINTTNVDTNFVKWYFVTGNKYLPWQRFRSIALEKIMKPEMRKSLDDFGHYLNNGAAEDGLAINDDFCDDSLIATKNITIDTTNNGINLFKEASTFKSQLIASGYVEAEISKNFYITQSNQKSFIAFGVVKKHISNINIIAIPNTVKQLDLLLNNKNGSTTNTMLALEKYAANKNYKIWNNLKLIKYINWQYATQNQKPNLKYLLFYQ
jgi:DNA gyrase/topoisomerase IV subunit A